MGGLFSQKMVLWDHLLTLKNPCQVWIRVSLDDEPSYPLSKWIYLILWKVISLRLSVSVTMTKTLGDMSSTHKQLKVSSNTLKHISHHHDMFLMYLWD